MGGHVQFRGCRDLGPEIGEAGDMQSKAAQRHGLLVRLPIRIGLRDAFQDAPCVFDFEIESRLTAIPEIFMHLS